MDEIREALSRLLNQCEDEKKVMQTKCENLKESISYKTVAQKVIDDISKYNQ
jgi:transposase